MAYELTQGQDQAVQVWSKLLMMQVIHKTFYGRFASTRGDMPFQIITDLTKGAGDTIKYDLLEQMTTYGVNANNTLSGNEASLSYEQDEIIIEQKRIGHAWYRMSQQRTIHQLRKDAMQNIRDRWATVLDKYVFAYLAGDVGTDSSLGTDITGHGANTLTDFSADTGHNITTYSSAQFSPACISDARWNAEQQTVPIRKIPIAPGLEGYVMFIHPKSAKNLQEDSDWIANVRYADPRGMKNRLWTGAMGIYNDVLIIVTNNLPVDTGDVCYSILCGAQAATIAFGNAFDTLDQQRYGKEFVFSWQEKTNGTDYNNIKGVAGGCIFGVKRTIFDDEAYGCVRVVTDET